MNELAKVAKGAKENLGVERFSVIADSGFFDSVHIKDCVESGITPYVTEQKFIGTAKRAGIPTREFYKDKFVYNTEADAYTRPRGTET